MHVDDMPIYLPLILVGLLGYALYLAIHRNRELERRLERSKGDVDLAIFRMEQDAINHGHARWVLLNKWGETNFEWVKPDHLRTSDGQIYVETLTDEQLLDAIKEAADDGDEYDAFHYAERLLESRRGLKKPLKKS